MLERINFVLGGIILPFLLCAIGLFFIFKLKFFYILHPVRTIKHAFRSSGGFKPLCVALAGTLGVGNIVGVCSAIMMGGAGAVFWMLISAIVAMSVKYAEAFLSIKHRRGSVGNYYGGAPYYIADATKGRGHIFGGIFALLCILNSLSTGALVQISSVSDAFGDKRLLFGAVFVFVCFLVVLGGEGRIQAVSSALIPLLSLLYIGISLFIIFSNPEGVCVAISRIFKEAFSFKSVLGGGVGFGISSAIRYGFTRGLLSNEAGCGSATMAHASSSLNPHSQGCLGIFEVFWDTVVLCLLTALVVLIADTDAHSAFSLATSSFKALIGPFGEWFIICACALFALATVCSQFYYGERSLRFLSRSRGAYFAYCLIFLFVCLISPIVTGELLWGICDLIVTALALYNLVFLVILSREVK